MKRFLSVFSLCFLTFICMQQGVQGQTTLSINLAGQWPFHPTKATALDDDRGLVFLGDGEQLVILNESLNRISSIKVTDSGQIGGLYYEKADNLLYAASRSDGLWIIDVSDPVNPFKAGSYKETDSLVDIFSAHVTEQTGYLAAGISGVIIVDVADPSDISVLSAIDLPGAFGFTYAVDTFVFKDLLYVADVFNGVHVIDVSDPEDPEPLRLLALPNARDVFVENEFLFASLESGGLEIVNMSDPENPTEASVYQVEGLANRVARANGNTAYVGFDQAGLHILDITDISNPIHKPEWEYTNTGVKSIAIDSAGQTAYITDDQIGLQRIDVSDPENLTQLSEFDTPADAAAVDIAGDYAYILDDTVGDTPENEGLRIFRMTVTNNVIEFSLSGFFTTQGKASDVAVFGENAYVADGENGLQIIDILDKTAPGLKSQLDTPGTAEAVFVNSGFTYVADGEEGLAVIDTGNPAEPELIASVDTPGYAGDVFISGDFAYVADGDNGLVIISVSGSTAVPKLVGSVKTPGTAEGVAVDNKYAFVADGRSGLTVIDIANKKSPAIAASFNTPGYTEKISITASIAYLADGKNGMTVLDVSNPLQPTRIKEWSFDTNGYASDIYSGYSFDDEAFVFVASGPMGVVVLNPTLESSGGNEGIDTGGGGSSGCFIEGLR